MYSGVAEGGRAGSPLKEPVRAAVGYRGRITALRSLAESPESPRSHALSSATIARPRLRSDSINGLLEQPSRRVSCYCAVIATEIGANSSSASPSWKMESVMVVVPAFLPMSLKAQYSGAAGGSMASSEVSATAMPSL